MFHVRFCKTANLCACAHLVLFIAGFSLDVGRLLVVVSSLKTGFFVTWKGLYPLMKNSDAVMREVWQLS